jgi:hypothetical protein
MFGWDNHLYFPVIWNMLKNVCHSVDHLYRSTIINDQSNIRVFAEGRCSLLNQIFISITVLIDKKNDSRKTTEELKATVNFENGHLTLLRKVMTRNQSQICHFHSIMIYCPFFSDSAMLQRSADKSVKVKRYFISQSSVRIKYHAGSIFPS